MNSGSGSESSSDKSLITTEGDESSGLGSVSDRTNSACGGSTNGGGGGLFDPETLPTRIAELRRDLLSLITLDNELFKNLLTINDTIEEMREQKTSVNTLQGKPLKLLVSFFDLI